MASILIRRVDEEMESQLRIRAASKGHSMEQEALDILSSTLASDNPQPVHIVDAIRRRIELVGGVDLPAIPRDPMPNPPILDE